MGSKTKKKAVGALAGSIAAAGAAFSIKLMDVEEELSIDNEIEIVSEDIPMDTVPEILPEPLHSASTDIIGQLNQIVVDEEEPDTPKGLGHTDGTDEFVVKNNIDEELDMNESGGSSEDASLCLEELIPILDEANITCQEEENDLEIDVTYDHDDTEREDTENDDRDNAQEDEWDEIQEERFDVDGNDEIDCETDTSESDSEIGEYNDLRDKPSNNMDIDPISCMFITV